MDGIAFCVHDILIIFTYEITYEKGGGLTPPVILLQKGVQTFD